MNTYLNRGPEAGGRSVTFRASYVYKASPAGFRQSFIRRAALRGDCSDGEFASNATTKRDFHDISIFSRGKKSLDGRTLHVTSRLRSEFLLVFSSPLAASSYARPFDIAQIRILVTSLNARCNKIADTVTAGRLFGNCFECTTPGLLSSSEEGCSLLAAGKLRRLTVEPADGF